MYEAQDLGSGREYALKVIEGLRLRGSPRVPKEGVSSATLSAEACPRPCGLCPFLTACVCLSQLILLQS